MRAYIDTNVIIRTLVQDAPGQSQAARDLFALAAEGEVELLLSETTLAEAEWVLRSVYARTRGEIATALKGVVAAVGTADEGRDVALAAIDLYEDLGFDFTDALLAARALVYGPPLAYSFDRDFEQVPGLRRLEPGEALA